MRKCGSTNVIDPLDPVDMAAPGAGTQRSRPERTLNLLGPGPAASREVLAAVCWGRRRSKIFATDATQLTGALSGRLFALPAGEVEMILGTEWRKEAVQFDSLFGAFEREVAGGFAEVEVPLLGESMQLPAARELTLTLAGRFDRYTDFGEIFSPQYGLVWRPFREVAVRATYGRSFRAPSLYELYLPDVLAHDASRRIRGATARPTARCSWLAGRPSSKPLAANLSQQASSSLPKRSVPPQVVGDLLARGDGRPCHHAEPGVRRHARIAVFADRVLRADPTAEELAAGRPGRIVQIDASRMNSRTPRRRAASMSARATNSTVDCRSLCSGCESHVDRQVRVARLAG